MNTVLFTYEMDETMTIFLKKKSSVHILLSINLRISNVYFYFGV